MKTYCNYFNKTFILLLFIVTFISCNKDPDSIGLELQPATDRLSVIYADTFSILAYSVIDDSLRTDNYDPNLLGSIVDPIFGVSTASIFTQISLSNDDVVFGTSPVLDSLVLTIPYTGIYNYSWQRPTPQHIKVFQVTTAMSIDSAYYSNELLSYDKYKVLADMTFVPDATDSVIVAGVTYPAILRIKFNSYFGNKLLSASSANYVDNTTFTQFLEGLFIRTEPLSPSMTNKGSIMYFDLLSALTNLTLYYKQTNSVTDTSEYQYQYLINSACARCNYFDHNGYADASSNFKAQLGIGQRAPNTSLGKQTIFLQSMGGTKVNMLLPTVRNLLKDKTGKNQMVAINEAVLVFQNAAPNDYFSPPATLTMLEKFSNDSTALLPDIIEGSTFFDGTYNYSTRQYKVRITRYLQQLLNTYSANPNYIDQGLYMLVNDRRTTGNRVMLQGANGGGIKLEIKYNILK